MQKPSKQQIIVPYLIKEKIDRLTNITGVAKTSLYTQHMNWKNLQQQVENQLDILTKGGSSGQQKLKFPDIDE